MDGTNRNRCDSLHFCVCLFVAIFNLYRDRKAKFTISCAPGNSSQKYSALHQFEEFVRVSRCEQFEPFSSLMPASQTLRQTLDGEFTRSTSFNLVHKRSAERASNEKKDRKKITQKNFGLAREKTVAFFLLAPLTMELVRRKECGYFELYLCIKLLFKRVKSFAFFSPTPDECNFPVNSFWVHLQLRSAWPKGHQSLDIVSSWEWRMLLTKGKFI